MISFKEFSPDNRVEVAEHLLSLLPEAAEDITAVVESCLQMAEDNPDVELALCISNGCALVRIFELGRYYFAYPIALIDGADGYGALEELRAYSVKEEVPLVLVDVPREELLSAVGYFRHTSVDMSDAEGECFRVTAQSEASLLSELPLPSVAAVTLSPLLDEHTEPYAALCRDSEVNKYWGYDFRGDAPDAEDGYFIRSARMELARGVSVTYAATEKNNFVGEAVIYAFDLLGGAEIAFRLLPEWQGKGLGRATLEALIEAGRAMGLLRLYATVHGENVPSLKLLSHYAEGEMGEDGRVHFVIEL